MTQLPATRPEAIRHARSPRDIALVRALFVEYAHWLRVDLCFQGFEHELATLPGAYAPPHGCLLLAGLPDVAFGCIALRPLDTVPVCGGAPAPRSADSVAEVKRLFVQSAHRGKGWGLRLARTVLDEARVIGFGEVRLDTFAWMTAARAMYSNLGFRECAPYYDNPLAGVVYMSLAL